MLNRKGERIRNPSPPVCERTPCWDGRAGRKRLRFGPDDVAAYHRWQLCRAFGGYPLPGSLSEQNPWDMERFRILESFERAAERATQFCPFMAMGKKG